MNRLPSYNLDPTAGNPAATELNVMLMVPLLDRAFETSIAGCGCGDADGCGSGGSCKCGSQNGGGDGHCGGTT